MRNSDFSLGKMQTEAFEDIKNELCANPLLQQYSLQKEATLLLTPLKKPLAGFLRKKDIQSYLHQENRLQRTKTTRT